MRLSGKSLRVRAPAKINLFLEINGRRANGYHDLRSVLVPVSLYDELTIEAVDEGIETHLSEGGSAALDQGRLGGSDGNLATRAARALRDATGYAGGARIRLEKHIPVGGGMGGGSSDAAAALNGLNRLWGTGLSAAALAEIGSRIGCDVPALVHGRAVLAEGLGEVVTPLPDLEEARSGVPAPAGREGWWVVLANPGFGVSTADIYARCQTPLTAKAGCATNIIRSVLNGDVRLAADSLFNGLQPTVFRKYPVIEMLVEALVAAGAEGAQVSGSGATVFGLARNEDHARRVAGAVGDAVRTDLWTRVVRTLPDGVMAAHGPLEA